MEKLHNGEDWSNDDTYQRRGGLKDQMLVPVVAPGLMVTKRISGYLRAILAIHRAAMSLVSPEILSLRLLE